MFKNCSVKSKIHQLPTIHSKIPEISNTVYRSNWKMKWMQCTFTGNTLKPEENHITKGRSSTSINSKANPFIIRTFKFTLHRKSDTHIISVRYFHRLGNTLYVDSKTDRERRLLNLQLQPTLWRIQSSKSMQQEAIFRSNHNNNKDGKVNCYYRREWVIAGEQSFNSLQLKTATNDRQT